MLISRKVKWLMILIPPPAPWRCIMTTSLLRFHLFWCFGGRKKVKLITQTPLSERVSQLYHLSNYKPEPPLSKNGSLARPMCGLKLAPSTPQKGALAPLSCQTFTHTHVHANTHTHTTNCIFRIHRSRRCVTHYLEDFPCVHVTDDEHLKVTALGITSITADL